MGNGYKEG